MTLRDLSKRQIYNLRRRCEKDKKLWQKRNGVVSAIWSSYEQSIWEGAYNAALKAGLEIPRP